MFFKLTRKMIASETFVNRCKIGANAINSGRNISEFYPLGIPENLVVEMKQNCIGYEQVMVEHSNTYRGKSNTFIITSPLNQRKPDGKYEISDSLLIDHKTRLKEEILRIEYEMERRIMRDFLDDMMVIRDALVRATRPPDDDTNIRVYRQLSGPNLIAGFTPLTGIFSQGQL